MADYNGKPDISLRFDKTTPSIVVFLISRNSELPVSLSRIRLRNGRDFHCAAWTVSFGRQHDAPAADVRRSGDPTRLQDRDSGRQREGRGRPGRRENQLHGQHRHLHVPQYPRPPRLRQVLNVTVNQFHSLWLENPSRN